MSEKIKKFWGRLEGDLLLSVNESTAEADPNDRTAIHITTKGLEEAISRICEVYCERELMEVTEADEARDAEINKLTDLLRYMREMHRAPWCNSDDVLQKRIQALRAALVRSKGAFNRTLQIRGTLIGDSFYETTGIGQMASESVKDLEEILAQDDKMKGDV